MVFVDYDSRIVANPPSLLRRNEQKLIIIEQNVIKTYCVIVRRIVIYLLPYLVLSVNLAAGNRRINFSSKTSSSSYYFLN